MFRKLLLLFLILLPISVLAQTGMPTKVVDDAAMTGDVTFSADTVYVLDGFVFVEDGNSLTIEAGTIIKAKEGASENASALIIARGGMIHAEGTATNPIIFTAEADDVDDPNDLPLNKRGEWGGVIILGKATLNVAGGEANIEGIPLEETRGIFGGTDDADSSGVFKYVSIRHGGSKLGEGDEINGLSLGAVGNRTVIENVEIYANLDDGFEFFGGTVNTKYLIAAFCGDDAFDYDMGFRGKGQFWFTIYGDDMGGSGGEHDGGTDPEDGTPYSMPKIYNATYIGTGANSTVTGNDLAINLRDNAGGMYFNSIFTDFFDKAIKIEDLDGTGEDSRKRLEAGELQIKNNIFWGFGAGNTFADMFKFDSYADDFIYNYMMADSNRNQVTDPILRGISRTNNGKLDPRPVLNSAAYFDLFALPSGDDFYTPVNYKGAFGADNWLEGWTFLSESGIISTDTKPTKVVNDAAMTGDMYFTADTTYILDGFVFVEDGNSLTIEAGTVIKAMEGASENASALIIARGGKIYAEGTPTQPIIFTAMADDVNDPYDLPLNKRGEWGGVIILGKATLNVAGGEANIEGIPLEETRGVFGGTDDDDNSGVFKYVSIRHGGSKLGEGDEINGLSLGAVGRRTVIENVEIYANLDDGFEFFGGTVNTKYLIAAFCGDDAFDYDMGFRGKGQFWVTIYDDDMGGSGGEHDGGTDPEDGTPYSMPVIYNATYIGTGAASTVTGNDLAINLRDNAGGKYFNSIFTDFFDKGVKIEDLDGTGEDSRKRLEAGELEFTNNLFWAFGAGNTADDIFKFDSIADDFIFNYMSADSNNNDVVDPMLRGISRTNDGGFDPRPDTGSPAWSEIKALPSGDDFYTPVNYRGAFGKFNWAANWTFLSDAGILTSAPYSSAVEPTKVVNDAAMTGDVYFSADTTYVLDGFVYVEDGNSLTIEPGTVIKAKEGAAENASALIIARGGKIYAEGTPTNPIIFTAEADDVNDPNDLPLNKRGEWGGVIILGKATLNVAGGEANIEGIPLEESRGIFGGTDDDDNSGVFKYVSIRHGGSKLGEGDEINGLSLGAVGRGTVIENVEIYANLDDGFEFFGGTVNTRYLIAAFCGDDAFDYDMGFRGKGQFWLTIYNDDIGGSGGEHDGGTDPEDGTPYSMPVIYNATYIGTGANSTVTGNDLAVNLRDNAGGKYFNSIFTEFFDKGVKIEDLDGTGEDSRKRLEAGELEFTNNLFWGFGAGNTFEDIFKFDSITDDFIYNYMSADSNMNAVADPMLRGISRTNDRTFDPRPSSTSIAWSDVKAIPAGDDFFIPANYKGAFGTQNWAANWTFLSETGILTNQEVTDVEVEFDGSFIPEKYELKQNYPNPFNPTTSIEYSLPKASVVKLTVYNVLGQKVAELVNEMKTAGNHKVTFDASRLASGIYIYRLQTGSSVYTRKMTLVK